MVHQDPFHQDICGKINLSVDPSNKFSEPRKKQKQTGGEDFDVSFEADNLDKDDKDMDFFP